MERLRGVATPLMARAQRLGGRGALPRQWSLPMQRLRGTSAPNGAAQWWGGQGVLPSRQSQRMERLRGLAAPNGADPLAAGDGESCLGGGRNLLSACGRWQPPMVRTHWLGGQGVVTRRRSQPMESLRGMVAPNGSGPPAGGRGVVPRWLSQPTVRLRGMAAPNGAGPQVGGTGSLAQATLGQFKPAVVQIGVTAGTCVWPAIPK